MSTQGHSGEPSGAGQTSADEKRRVRLVVADDHTLLLQGLVALLKEEPKLEVVGQATTGRKALEEVRRLRPDIALLDITMPDMNGLEVTRAVTAQFPEVKVLILTMHEEEAFFFEALRAGASGYVLKGASSEELLSAIFAVSEGGVYLPPKLAGTVLRDYLDREKTGKDSPPREPLTPREEEVLRLIAQGLTNQEIAERLVLGLNTVKTHRLHIYQKLGLHTRADLVEYAMRRGLLR